MAYEPFRNPWAGFFDSAAYPHPSWPAAAAWPGAACRDRQQPPHPGVGSPRSAGPTARPPAPEGAPDRRRGRLRLAPGPGQAGIGGRPSRAKRFPEIPTLEEFRRILAEAYRADPRDGLLLRLLFESAVRV